MNLEVHKQGEQAVSKEQLEVLDKKRNEYKLVNSMRRRRGLILYSYNPDTKELKEVELVQSEVSIGLEGKPRYSSKAQVTSNNAHYFWALNRRNAEKKVSKIIKQL